MNFIKKWWSKIKGDGFPQDTVSALGVRVKTNGQEIDTGYIDIAVTTVSYWTEKKIDPDDILVEVMPPCPTHGKCCFVDGADHFHGRIRFGVIQTSAKLCTIHNLIGQIVTGEKPGSHTIELLDRLDWIGKDYE